MQTAEEFAYVKLISALKGIAIGKGLHDHIEADIGRRFEIISVLHHAAGLEGDFAGDHVEYVRNALAAWNVNHAGNDIAGCVRALLSSKRAVD